jgi:peptidyl-prolyl cis-trans isomerase D
MKGVVAWAVSIILVAAFALWGVPELRNFTQRAPLRVGDVSFSSDYVVREFNREMEQRRRESGGKFGRDEAVAAGLPDQVVSALATRTALDQEAEKMGLVMPRALVRRELQEDERFHNPATGKFDRFALQSILQNNGMTVEQFEAAMKEDLRREQLVNAITAGGRAPEAMVEALALRDVERRRVAYLTITDDMAGVPEEPTPDALKTYYEENKDKFTAPEYRTFTAVILRYADFAEKGAASEEELRKIYEASKARLYDKPETRTIYQLTYETEAEARAAAESLKRGKPFENLASERGLTLAQATLTEAVKKDILDPTVGEAAFAPELVEGDVVGPVKSLFGWTVVQLAAKTPAQTKMFEEVREEIAADRAKQENRRLLLDTIDEIEEARDTGATLAAAAEQAGLKAVRYGPVDSFSFAPGGAIVPDIPGDVLTTAFTIGEGEESDARELTSEDGYFLLQVDEVTPPAPLAFEDVTDEVAERWRDDERKRRIAATVKQVTDALASGATFDKAAEPFNRAVLEITLARGSDSSAFSPALVEEVFAAAPNAVVVGDAGSGAAQTIAQVREIGFARERIPQQQLAAYAQFLGFQMTQEQLDAYLSALRADHRVRIDQAALAQLFSGEQ